MNLTETGETPILLLDMNSTRFNQAVHHGVSHETL